MLLRLASLLVEIIVINLIYFIQLAINSGYINLTNVSFSSSSKFTRERKKKLRRHLSHVRSNIFFFAKVLYLQLRLGSNTLHIFSTKLRLRDYQEEDSSDYFLTNEQRLRELHLTKSKIVLYSLGYGVENCVNKKKKKRRKLVDKIMSTF